jgi:hypothetical protein
MEYIVLEKYREEVERAKTSPATAGAHDAVVGQVAQQDEF